VVIEDHALGREWFASQATNCVTQAEKTEDTKADRQLGKSLKSELNFAHGF
jgi:hypothetical protein